jgi:hypothetical protein
MADYKKAAELETTIFTGKAPPLAELRRFLQFHLGNKREFAYRLWRGDEAGG